MTFRRRLTDVRFCRAKRGFTSESEVLGDHADSSFDLSEWGGLRPRILLNHLSHLMRRVHATHPRRLSLCHPSNQLSNSRMHDITF